MQNNIEEITTVNPKNLENTTYIQLKRILSFFNHDTQEKDYNLVKEKINTISKPLVAKTHYGERIWSYFYQKYNIKNDKNR